MQQEDKRPEGLLVVHKPRGWSSMRVVSDIRRRAGGARTGHAGTLDPLAEGVLVLALGRATRLLDRFMRTRKGYRTVIGLDAFTATDDEEAPREEVSVDASAHPASSRIRELLSSWHGVVMQRPPAYSAMKVSGRRAYKSAREGRPVTLEPRPVEVHALELIAYDWPEATIDIACGKGFYVRAFARQLGETLGTGGYCHSILRTRVGPFTLDEARGPEDLPPLLTQADVIAVDEALARLEGE